MAVPMPTLAETNEGDENDPDFEAGYQGDARNTIHSPDGDQAVGTALSQVSSGPPYSVFSLRMKKWIVAMHCISAFISPVTSNIYFPAIPALAHDLGISLEQINLTLTTYMIFQALSPTLFGDFGDVAGRRPAFIITCLIYIGANIGLALQKDYVSLLVLRMLQSSGSSGTLALAYAVVADIVPSAERGKWMGIVGTGITVGPAIGPVIVCCLASLHGGLLNAYLGWPWIFWFLIILIVAWLIPYTLAVPETAREVVGNGSIPPRGWNITFIDIYRFRHQRRSRLTAYRRRKIPFPNPLNTLKVLGHKDITMIISYNSCLFLCLITVTATLGSQMREVYGYKDLILGVFYLPLGCATAIASLGGGFVADWNFRRIAKKTGLKIDRKRGNDMANFPLEKARIQLITPLIFIGAGACMGYGWALERKANVAVPLVLSFLIGFCVSWPFQILNLLFVDIYPQAPATATAANNLVRCLAGAAATAAIQPLITRIGRGWSFTLLGLIIAVPAPILWVVARHGQAWRKARIQKMMEELDRDGVQDSEKQDMPVEGNPPSTVGMPLP